MLIFTATTPLGQAFVLILTALCQRLLTHVANSPHQAVLLAAYSRLRRLAARLDRLVQHFHAGTLPNPRPSRAGQSRAQTDQPRLAIPSGHAWLIRRAQTTAQLAGQVEAFLHTQETRALLAAAPQAGRLLRPLCRALGVTPPEWLRLPARPETPRPSRAKPQPSPPAGTPDRPLPPYVRRAVRAWRKKPA